MGDGGSFAPKVRMRGPTWGWHTAKVRLLLLLLVACAGTATTTGPKARATTGSIAGVARDHDSGETIAKASISVHADGDPRPRVVLSDAQGHYALAGLPPGDYSVSASFAGQVIDVGHVGVKVGDPTIVDLTFTLGRPEPITLVYGDAKLGAIDRYRPPHLAAGAAVIEGTITDTATRDRIAGATVSIVGPGSGPNTPTQLAVSDDEGRYHFDVTPGTYTVSAYYSVNQRQIEARRSEIAVADAEAVVVPLWIEAQR